MKNIHNVLYLLWPKLYIPSCAMTMKPPNQPRIHIADLIKENIVTLIWENLLPNIDKSIQGYLLKYRKVGNKNWHRLKTEPITDSKYIVYKLRPNVGYEFCQK